MKFTNEGFQIKRLTKADIPIAQQLFQVLQQVFEVEKLTKATDNYIDRLLESPHFICFAVIYKDEVAGGLTAYELPMYHAECSELFIYDIAVKAGLQRMGIGKKLIDAVKQYCRDNGIKELFVDACETDEHAVDFYRSMPGKEEKIIQFTYHI